MSAVAHDKRRPNRGVTVVDRGSRDERGYALVLTALMMVGMVVLAALVVDVGAVYAKRRTDQSAADAGATAAAQDLSNEATAVAKAKQWANDNLPVALSDAAWNSCGADLGSLERKASGANCISFDNAHSRIRVRIPDQYHDTSFGSVVGIDEVRHSAFAIAGVHGVGFGGVLPFGLPNGVGSGEGYACLKSDSNGAGLSVCGSTAGNFGTLDFTFFGNASTQTPHECGGNAKARISENIAIGVDHGLTLKTAAVTGLVDSDACESLTPGPNGADTLTGNFPPETREGLAGTGTFIDGGPSRLRRFNDNLFGGNGRTRSVGGQEIDDNGLWEFIPDELVDVPNSCQRDQFESLSNLPVAVRTHISSMSPEDQKVALLTRCISHYQGLSWTGGGAAGLSALTPPEPPSGCGGTCTGAVFSLNSSSDDSPNLYDIQYTPRFAYVPELTEPTFPNGKKVVYFKAFRAVYIQTLMFHNTRFDPGGFGTSNIPMSNGNFGVTAFVLPEGMLPNGLGMKDAVNEIGKNRFVQLVR